MPVNVNAMNAPQEVVLSVGGLRVYFRSEEEVARFAINRHRFPGVDIQVGLSRHYPLGSHAGHAIGYVGRINEEELERIDTGNYRGTTHIGKEGIEKAYEDLLHGKVGYDGRRPTVIDIVAGGITRTARNYQYR